MIKINMDMPKTCNDCPFLFYAKNCALTIKQVELNSKPDWCPLIAEELITPTIKINKFTYQNPCTYCSNNPENGGSGICHCTLGTPKITL